MAITRASTRRNSDRIVKKRETTRQLAEAKLSLSLSLSLTHTLWVTRSFSATRTTIIIRRFSLGFSAIANTYIHGWGLSAFSQVGAILRTIRRQTRGWAGRGGEKHGVTLLHLDRAAHLLPSERQLLGRQPLASVASTAGTKAQITPNKER